MNISNSLEIVEEKIDNNREKLNQLILVEGDKDIIINLSMELDKYINLYYRLLDENLIFGEQKQC